MKFYRSVLVIALVVATWLMLSLGLSEVSALESNSLARNASPAQQYAMKLTPLQSQLLELQALIEKERWSEVQSFLRGPLGDLEVRLRFLKNSFTTSQKVEASKKIESISKSLTRLDASAAVGNQQRSLKAAEALMDTFDEILSLAGIRDINLAQSSPAEVSLKVKAANGPIQKPNRLSAETFPKLSTEKNERPVQAEKTLQTGTPRSNSGVEISSSPSGNNTTDDTLSTNQNTMDTNLYPDLTYLALLFLVPLTIYLQIRYQHKHQADQDRVAELEEKIETLNQDKANLGSALEQTQGRLVTMFMDLEETKPLARLLQQRTITVEEQEELMEENDSFVQALLQQAETVSPEEKPVEG